jgi:Domain of unknown function (DUF4296)
MKNIYSFIVMLILLTSCGNSIVEKPDNLIDDDVMIDIFYDLTILDAAKNSSYENGVSTFEANDFIFKKYKIDSLQFAKSNKYWAADVPKYKRMYKIVKDKINDKKTELEAIIKAKEKIKK